MNLEELKIYVVSDSLGETGEIVVRAAIAQFKTDNYKIKRYSYIQDVEHLLQILNEASDYKNSLLIYTLVNKQLVRIIEKFSDVRGLVTVDLMSPLIEGLSLILENEPTRESGAMRKLDEAYFKRVAAIEFAVKYDDGKDPRGLLEADIVLLGVSRTSKTPLSMYLANKNIKVANVPLVVEASLPEEIYQVSAKKFIGLTNSPEKLNKIRGERLKSLGLPNSSNYANFSRIMDELEYAERIMKRIGCPIIDVSNKAIEETAEIIVSYLSKNGIKFN